MCVFIGSIEVIYTSAVDDFGGPEVELQQEEPQPST